MNNKSVICIPHGGLNDSLCQIEKCRAYCEKFNRILYIDTTKSGLMLEFKRFFKFKSNLNFNFSEMPSINVLNELSAFPAELSGRIDGIKSYYSLELGLMCQHESQIILSFDFQKDYSEEILIHEQCGGGTGAHKLINYLMFSDEVNSFVSNNISNLPTIYDAIHIRNSDYKTDYVGYFNLIQNNLENENLLICSDDDKVVEYAQSFFKDHNVLNFGGLVGNGYLPPHLHENYDSDSRMFEATARSLADLIALASCKNLYFTSVINDNRVYNITSGFSLLAKYIHSNKLLISSLLGVEVN